MLRLIIAILAILAPALHLASDVMEWAGGGFSTAQLLINYLAFLLMPFMMIGLYSIQSQIKGQSQIRGQRPKAGWTDAASLAGAVLYSISFIYFAHTTLYALQESVRDYETLWHKLGAVYTFHGGLMVAGGLLFGTAALGAGVFRRSAVIIFIAGILLNFLLSLLPLPEILQIAGSTLRNLGLMGIGVGLIVMQDLDS